MLDWLPFLKGLTLRNVAILFALAALAIPSFIAYKLTTDREFASIFFSTYREAPIPGTSCFMRIASVSGGSEDFRISRPFAYSNRDRWVVSLETPEEPSADQAVELCDLLAEVVEYARDRSKPSPAFPGTDIKIFPEIIQIR